MKKKPVQQQQKKTVTKAPARDKPKTTAYKSFVADAYVEKYGLWFTLGLVVLLIGVIFHRFITGEFYYLFKDIGSDSLNGWFPQIVHVSRSLTEHTFPLWSHAQGMGQNTMAQSITDPFTFIIYLFGPDNLETGMVWMEISKIILTASVLYGFFRLWKLSSHAAIIGALLYCFGGFMIVGGGWSIFSTEAFFLSLLLFSFELLYRKNAWYLFPIAVTLIISHQPVNLYLYGLFLVCYFLFRHFSSDTPRWSRFWKLSLQMAGLSLLGIVISAFLLTSQMQLLLDSPRVGGNSSHTAKLLSTPVFSTGEDIYYATAFFRLMSNDLLGNGSNFKGWYNYLEAPMWYIGLLPLLLMPQVFIFGTRRKKIAYGIFFLVLMIPVIFPFFRYAVWLFTGDYYRGFSVFYSLLILLAALDVLNEILKGSKVNLYLLGATLLILLAALFYPYESTKNIIDKDLRSVIVNFLLIYTVLLSLSRFIPQRSLVVAGLVVAVAIEMGYMTYKTVNDRVVLPEAEKKQRAGYYDYTVDAIKFINDNDKQFFRVNKDFQSNPAMHFSMNDAKVQGYYGTMSYSSFNQKYYIRFMEEMNIISKGREHQTRWAWGLATRPLLQNWASTKYQLCKKPAPMLVKFSYDSIGRFGNVSVFRNKHFLPLGFTYDTYVEKESFLKASPNKKDQIIQQALVVEDPNDQEARSLNPFDFRDTAAVYTFDLFNRDVKNRKQDTLAITRFSANRITGTIALEQKKVLFFSIPYDKGWHGRIDGKAVEPMLCNIGFLGFVLEPGSHQVELYYSPPYFLQSLYISIGGILIYLLLVILRRSNKIHLFTVKPGEQ